MDSIEHTRAVWPQHRGIARRCGLLDRGPARVRRCLAILAGLACLVSGCASRNPAHPVATPTVDAAAVARLQGLKAKVLFGLGLNRSTGRSDELEALAKLTSYVVTETDPPNVKIQLALDDELTNLLWAAFLLSAHKDYAETLKVFDDPSLPYGTVTIDGTMRLKDKFGNTSPQVVCSATYSKATIGKINWPEFSEDNVWEIADQSVVAEQLKHP